MKFKELIINQVDLEKCKPEMLGTLFSYIDANTILKGVISLEDSITDKLDNDVAGALLLVDGAAYTVAGRKRQLILMVSCALSFTIAFALLTLDTFFKKGDIDTLSILALLLSGILFSFTNAKLNKLMEITALIDDIRNTIIVKGLSLMTEAVKDGEDGDTEDTGNNVMEEVE